MHSKMYPAFSTRVTKAKRVAMPKKLVLLVGIILLVVVLWCTYDGVLVRLQH